MTTAINLSAIDVTDPLLYASRGYPWADWDLLRREAPVYWYDRPGFEPFWAITRHEDILTISKRSDVFVNSQRLRIFPIEVQRQQEGQRQLYTFNDMDAPKHSKHRNLTSRAFTPKALRALEGHIQELSNQFVDEFAQKLVDDVAERGSCDFVRELSIKLPLAGICEMFGVPADDWYDIFMWTETLFGSSDPEFQRPGETSFETGQRASQAFFAYIAQLVARRRAEGATGTDLVSALVRGQVDGEPLTEKEIQDYIFLLLAAGNETTRNATTGGVIALLQNPDQRDLLCARPELIDSAVEEILRWTTPVIQFMRTAVADFELRGTLIRAGESVGLFYPSANRDEEVFTDAYRFDITRSPNDHLAFGGFGAHFCLGANLARWELRGIIRALLRILPDMELAGEPSRMVNNHVGSVKHLPVTYRPAARRTPTERAQERSR